MRYITDPQEIDRYNDVWYMKMVHADFKKIQS